MPRMEVRCCCEPWKVRGWVYVGGTPRVGQVLSFAPVREWNVWLRDPGEPTVQVERTIRLEVAEIQDGGRRYPALKSEDLPIETLRRIHGFTENRHA